MQKLQKKKYNIWERTCEVSPIHNSYKGFSGKDMKDLCCENHKILRKEIEIPKKGMIFNVHKLKELLSQKRPYYSKQFTDSSWPQSKYQGCSCFFVRQRSQT